MFCYVTVGSKMFERKILMDFLSISLNLCFEYPQHMFWMNDKKINF